MTLIEKIGITQFNKFIMLMIRHNKNIFFRNICYEVKRMFKDKIDLTPIQSKTIVIKLLIYTISGICLYFYLSLILILVTHFFGKRNNEDVMDVDTPDSSSYVLIIFFVVTLISVPFFIWKRKHVKHVDVFFLLWTLYTVISIIFGLFFDKLRTVLDISLLNYLIDIPQIIILIYSFLEDRYEFKGKNDNVWIRLLWINIFIQLLSILIHWNTQAIQMFLRIIAASIIFFSIEISEHVRSKKNTWTWIILQISYIFFTEFKVFSTAFVMQLFMILYIDVIPSIEKKELPVYSDDRNPVVEKKTESNTKRMEVEEAMKMKQKKTENYQHNNQQQGQSQYQRPQEVRYIQQQYRQNSAPGYNTDPVWSQNVPPRAIQMGRKADYYQEEEMEEDYQVDKTNPLYLEILEGLRETIQKTSQQKSKKQED